MSSRSEVLITVDSPHFNGVEVVLIFTGRNGICVLR